MYNLGINIFKIFIAIASLFSKKIGLLYKGHRNLLSKIEREMSRIRELKPNSRTYLFHCASLGEFEQGLPIIEALKRKDPESIVILTFFSPSGYEMNKDNKQVDTVFYLPFDTKYEAVRFSEIIRADVAVFVKYEYWRNIFKALINQGTSLYVISALFQENMIFFKWYGGIFRQPLDFVSHFFVQDDNSVLLLNSLGYKNVTEAGDTRFDRVVKLIDRTPSERINKLEHFVCPDKPKFIAGSVWESDMKRLIPFIAAHPEIQFLIAPHNINNIQIDRWISQLPDNYKIAKFTDIEDRTDSTEDYNIIFINCVGILSQVYKFASLTFIGGGYDKLGIHNTLEAAVWRKPVIFGPIYSRYIEAVGLVKCGGAFVVKSTSEIEAYWKDFLQHGSEHAKIAGDFVFRNAGATDKIINHIE